MSTMLKRSLLRIRWCVDKPLREELDCQVGEAHHCHMSTNGNLWCCTVWQIGNIYPNNRGDLVRTPHRAFIVPPLSLPTPPKPHSCSPHYISIEFALPLSHLYTIQLLFLPFVDMSAQLMLCPLITCLTIWQGWLNRYLMFCASY